MGHMTNSKFTADGWVGNLSPKCVTIAQVLKAYSEKGEQIAA